MHLPKSLDRTYPARMDLLRERRLRRSLGPRRAHLCIATSEVSPILATSQNDARRQATFVAAAGMDSNPAWPSGCAFLTLPEARRWINSRLSSMTFVVRLIARAPSGRNNCLSFMVLPADRRYPRARLAQNPLKFPFYQARTAETGAPSTTPTAIPLSNRLSRKEKRQGRLATHHATHQRVRGRNPLRRVFRPRARPPAPLDADKVEPGPVCRLNFRLVSEPLPGVQTSVAATDHVHPPFEEKSAWTRNYRSTYLQVRCGNRSGIGVS